MAKLKHSNSIPQIGAKINWLIDGVDLSAYFLRHIDRRTPLFGTHQYKFLGVPPYRIVIPEDFKAFTFQPVPYYVMANELGITLETVYRDFILKLEGVNLKYDSHNNILTGQKVASTGHSLRKKENYTHLSIGVEKTVSLVQGHDTTFFGNTQKFLAFQRNSDFMLRHFKRICFWGFGTIFKRFHE